MDVWVYVKFTEDKDTGEEQLEVPEVYATKEAAEWRYNNAVCQALANIDKTMTTHLARKTFCRLLLNKGVSINTVAKCAGHADIKITRSYYATLQEATVIKEVKQAFQ